ncbi:hypothetical protein, partial [Halalkalibacter flavus]|uniref:hypothetical protein n=1 Tax=Halalkalibacter flavus TaxID=3090668 RepID=UPI002FCBEA91
WKVYFRPISVSSYLAGTVSFSLAVTSVREMHICYVSMSTKITEADAQQKKKSSDKLTGSVLGEKNAEIT